MLLESSILVLEDDTALAETLCDFLEGINFKCKTAHSLEDALCLTYKDKFAMYLFDAKLPDGNAFDLVKDLRNSGDDTPVIFITSATDKNSVLAGFGAGCDDYIKKPFDIDELGAKIKAIFKRIYGLEENGDVRLSKDAILKAHDGQIYINEQSFNLTQKEKALVLLLAKHKNHVVTKDNIANELWQDSFSDGALRVYISKLKNILKDNLVCVRGEGYKLVDIP